MTTIPTSVTVESPLIKSYIKYLIDIPQHEITIVYRSISRYTASLINQTEFGRTLKDLSKPTRSQVKAWRRWADRSYYWGCLWRVLLTNDDPEDWDVYPRDIITIVNDLTVRDQARLRALKGTIKVGRFGPHTMRKMQTELKRFCQNLAWFKLRFVSNYDSGVGLEDLSADLLEVAIRTVRHYEDSGDKAMALNYAKRAAQNTAFNLQQRYTAEKRCRIVDSESPKFEYRLTTTYYEDDFCGIAENLHNAVDLIGIRLGPQYEHYARAILGQWPEFDRWVKTWTRKQPENIEPLSLSALARHWVGLSEKQIKVNLVPLLETQ